MTAHPPPKSAADICRGLTLGRKARKLLTPAASARGFLRALVEAACWDDAIPFMAHALPARVAVWWACLCVRHSLGEKPTEVDKTAVLAATRWVVAPGERHHRHAEETAQVLGGKSPSGCVARAASQSGVMRNQQSAAVPPRPEMPARLAGAAILLAAASAGPRRRDLLCRQYIFIGLDVANSALRWE